MIQQFHLWVLTLTGKVICTSMFTAALFTIGKICKQPKCPLMDEENMIYIYIYIRTMEYYSDTKKKMKMKSCQLQLHGWTLRARAK